jgi:hypothetical protein
MKETVCLVCGVWVCGVRVRVSACGSGSWERPHVCKCVCDFCLKTTTHMRAHTCVRCTNTHTSTHTRLAGPFWRINR